MDFQGFGTVKEFTYNWNKEYLNISIKLDPKNLEKVDCNITVVKEVTNMMIPHLNFKIMYRLKI